MSVEEHSKEAMLQDNTEEPQQQLYRHSLFDTALRSSRKLLLRTLVLPIMYTSILMWACLSLYWGSTTYTSLRKLSVYAINLDDGAFGRQMITDIKFAANEDPAGLGWQFESAVKSATMSQELVMDEKAWAVVQINPLTSSSLEAALSSDVSAYNPLHAVTIYIASARNQITTNSKVVPAVLATINPLLARLSSEHTEGFLTSIAGNMTALRTALECRGCLSSPFAAEQVDLLPFDVPEAAGSTMVGLIFLLTFTFSIFQILHLNGELIGAQLNLESAVLFRLFCALSAYLIISLWFTLINLAFGIPMNRKFGHGAGFMVYWMLNTCTMASLGLPMESLFTLIGLKWAGYFLSFWIIVNVASSFTSLEVMPGFYSYGYGLPFFNSIQGARTIIFGTKNHLGQNFGILIAWMVVGAIGIVAFTAWTMEQNRRKKTHVVR